MTASNELRALLRERIDASAWGEDANVRCLVDEIRQRHGDRVKAVLLYGSYLRGKRDTLLDFYVLFDDFRAALPRWWHAPGNRLLPPNVYYLSVAGPGGELRAKYATLRLDQFERANRRDFHCYFWARFTQPCAVVFAQDSVVTGRVVDTIEAAVRTFVARVLPVLPARFTAAEFWVRGFTLTYAAELRAERPERLADLYNNDAQGFNELLCACAGSPGSALQGVGDAADTYVNAAGGRRSALLAWRVRRWQGKVLSLLRLLKAAATFDDPLDYLLWKIERHSGIRETATARQRRYPLLFAWSVIWRLYRRGAFR